MSVFSDIQRPVVVRARAEVADGVVALDLVPTNGRPLPPWTPGSHVDHPAVGQTRVRQPLDGAGQSRHRVPPSGVRDSPGRVRRRGW